METEYQKQYNLIYSFFKTTTEPFDSFEWDGKNLIVYLGDSIIEKYTYFDLKEIISNFF